MMTRKKINTVKPATNQTHLVTSKSYLALCLLIYLSSIFLIDYFGDSLAFKIKDAIANFFNRESGFHVVKRFVLWDIVIDLCFLTIVCRAFAKYPHTFFVFNGLKSGKEEPLWKVFLRVLRNCILTSFVLALFFGIIQGLLSEAPKYLTGIYVELYRPEMGIKWYDQPQYDFFGHGLKLINFSLIFVSLFRVGIIIRIIQEIFHHRGQKLVNPFLIFLALIPFILFAARFSQPHQYQKESLSDSTISRSLDKQDEDILELKKIEAYEPKIISEAPRAHITVYDPSTGKIISND